MSTPLYLSPQREVLKGSGTNLILHVFIRTPRSPDSQKNFKANDGSADKANTAQQHLPSSGKRCAGFRSERLPAAPGKHGEGDPGCWPTILMLMAIRFHMNATAATNGTTLTPLVIFTFAGNFCWQRFIAKHHQRGQAGTSTAECRCDCDKRDLRNCLA